MTVLLTAEHDQSPAAGTPMGHPGKPYWQYSLCEPTSNKDTESNRQEAAMADLGEATELSDILIGGANDDTFDGGAGSDAIEGGSGRDFLQGGAGRDHVLGGPGDDVVGS